MIKHFSIGFALLLLPSIALAKNQGCCVLKDKSCTTATQTICNALGGTLQGKGTQICDATKGCVRGLGCASCLGGDTHGEMCEEPKDCGYGGYCQSQVSFDSPLSLLDRQDLPPFVELLRPFQYVVKFVCGNPGPRGVALARGRYNTAINVHNPSLVRSTNFRYKVATALPALQTGTISGFDDVQLVADGALEIDCPTILARVNENIFATGFVVILAFQELDIVAVHTVGRQQDGEVISLDIEQVEGERTP